MAEHNHSTAAKPQNDPAMNLGQVGGKADRRMRLVIPARRGAVIRYLEEMDEWFVQFFQDGKHQMHMDYSTDDELDALATARYWINVIK